MAEEYRLKKLAKLISKKNKILDLGCSAIPNIYLKNKEVIGVDLVEKILPNNYTDLKICNVINLSNFFSNIGIDGIVAGEIIEHLEDPINFLKECFDTLSKNGLLVLSTPLLLKDY